MCLVTCPGVTTHGEGMPRPWSHDRIEVPVDGREVRLGGTRDPASESWGWRWRVEERGKLCRKIHALEGTVALLCDAAPMRPSNG